MHTGLRGEPERLIELIHRQRFQDKTSAAPFGVELIAQQFKVLLDQWAALSRNVVRPYRNNRFDNGGIAGGGALHRDVADGGVGIAGRGAPVPDEDKDCGGDQQEGRGRWRPMQDSGRWRCRSTFGTGLAGQRLTRQQRAGRDHRALRAILP